MYKRKPIAIIRFYGQFIDMKLCNGRVCGSTREDPMNITFSDLKPVPQLDRNCARSIIKNAIHKYPENYPELIAYYGNDHFEEITGLMPGF
jgi:hypothetical protein